MDSTLLLELPAAPGRGGHAAALAALDACVGPWAARAGPRSTLLLVGRNGREGMRLDPWPHVASAHVARAHALPAKNVMVRYAAAQTAGAVFAPAHDLVFFHVRSLKDYAFDKTPLRVPHAFKDVEWGGRTSGATGYHPPERVSRRYPDGGRDPGNVLHSETRRADGFLESIHESSRALTLAKLVEAVSAPGWTVHTNARDPTLADEIRARRRVVREVAPG